MPKKTQIVEDMIDKLSVEELRSIVKRIVWVLWLRDGKHLGELCTWDVNKQWDSDTTSDIADVLGFFGIRRAVEKAHGKRG